MTINDIEKELEIGQVNPHRLSEFRDWLSAQSSAMMDRQLELQLIYSQFFYDNRPKWKSDKALLMEWRITKAGSEELELEISQKKITILLRAIASHLSVLNNSARNLY